MTDPAHVVAAVQPLDWDAYDVPRIWDTVRREDDFLAWEQVKGFEYLARLLDAQRQRLRGLRETLVAAWDPATHPAAAGYIARLDDLIASLERDAIAHRSTSRALDAILTTLKAAKERMSLLKREWDNVTTDCVPQWWDNQAGDLNRRARHVIRQAEEAIADHRRRLLVAPAYPDLDAGGEPGRGNETGRKRRSRKRIVPPPPVPGYDPVPPQQARPAGTTELQTSQAVSQAVAAVPGSPVSLLPVPPGNPYAPGGGAYVLPGPGIGRGGWIYPMPSAGPVPDDDFVDWFAGLAMPWTTR